MTRLSNRRAFALCLLTALGLALLVIGATQLISTLVAALGSDQRLSHPAAAVLSVVAGAMILTSLWGRVQASRLLALILGLVALALLPGALTGLSPLQADNGRFMTLLPAIPAASLVAAVGYGMVTLVGRRAYVIWPAAAFLVMLGLVNLPAPVLNLPLVLRLGWLPEMVPVTALLVLTLGIALPVAPGVFSQAPIRGFRGTLIIGLVGILLSVTCWQLVQQSHSRDMTRRAELLADQTIQGLQASHRHELALIQRLAQRLEASPGQPPLGQWELEAHSYMRDLPHLQLLGLLDSQQRVLRVEARSSDARFWFHDFLSGPHVRQWLAAAAAGDHTGPTLSGPGGHGYALLSVPLVPADGVQWTLVALVDWTLALGWLDLRSTRQLTMRVADQALILKDTGQHQDGPSRLLWQEEFELAPGRQWTFSVREPMTRAVLDEYLSELLVLFSALLLTVLLMFSRALGLISQQRNRELTIANDQLADYLHRERTLRETNDRIMQFTNDLLCSIDRNGRFLFMSPASEAILGYRPDELLGRSALSFIVGDDREASRDVVRRTINGELSGDQQFRNRYYHRHGKTVTLLWKARWSAEDQTLFCVGRDISAELEAEKLTRQREAFFALTPEMFCIVSTEGRFVEVNRAFLSVLGFSRKDLIGHAYMDVIHPDDHSAIVTAVNQLLDGMTVYDLEFRIFDKSGALHWLRLNANLSDDQLIYCSARDITRELEIQDTLRQNEALLRIAEQAGRLGGWMVDVESGRSTWSDAVAEIHELPPGQEPVVEGAINYYTEDYRPIVKAAVERCIRYGTPFDLEARIRTARGNLRWARAIGRAVYNDEGQVVRLQGAFQDITAAKEASEQIRQLAERQARVFESITDAFFTLDRDWRFTFVNRRSEELLRISRQQLLGRSVWEAFPDAVGTEFETSYRQAISSGESVSFEAYFEPLDLWCEVHAYPSEDGIAVYFRSINERKIAEQKLQQTLAELERSNRDLQDFAFVASHDLQEPLRKIQTFGDRLQRNAGQLGEKERDYLARMQSAAGRMQTLIQDLLAYSRVSTRGRPLAPCDLNEILTEVCQDLETAIQRAGSTLTLEPLPAVTGDATQLRQVLQNLISNALKFRRADTPHQVRIHAEDIHKQGWTLVMEDNGTGFDPKYADRLFQPFQRLHSRNDYEGTGIGLAIVRKILDRHGASIRAEGRPGEGARFLIRFPASHSRQLTEPSPNPHRTSTEQHP